MQVFDDVATELAMAVLQFFSGQHSEEHIFRCMKGLLRFAYIAPSEVPMFIKMIGPDPTQFKGINFGLTMLTLIAIIIKLFSGMSSRIDEVIEKLSDRLRSVRGMV